MKKFLGKVTQEIVWRKIPGKNELSATGRVGIIDGVWPVGTELEVWDYGGEHLTTGAGEIRRDTVELIEEIEPQLTK